VKLAIIRVLSAAVILGVAGWFLLDHLRPAVATLPRPIVIEDAAGGSDGSAQARPRHNGADHARPGPGESAPAGQGPGSGAAPADQAPPCPAGDDPGEVGDDCDDGYEDLDGDDDPEADDTPDESHGDD
jgi:hypothetical protein